jgi:hypothetical protein
LQGEEEEAGYHCLYLGSVNMGYSGDVHLIEMGINTILNQKPSGQPRGMMLNPKIHVDTFLLIIVGVAPKR